MKKRSSKIILIIGLFAFFIGLKADMADLYRKKPLTLTPDPSFGKRVVWDDLFFDSFKRLLVLPDGNIFVSNVKASNIVKFNSSGDLIGTYGQRGVGPGDLMNPDISSILDGKLLLIGEYASNRRISLFDLNGKYVKVIKTKASCYAPIALKDNYIAYYTTKFFFSSNQKNACQSLFFIKDLASGQEKLVDTLNHEIKGISVNSVTAVYLDPVVGTPLLERMNNGNFLVGLSSNPVLKVYSSSGNLIHKIDLKITPLKVTSKYVDEFKNRTLLSYKNSRSPQEYEFFAKAFQKYDFRSLFEEYLPLFKQIFIDSDGNILVFKYLESFDPKVNVMQVYRPDGKFVCETTVITKGFKVGIDYRLRNIQFTDKGIFAIGEMDNSDDDTHVKLLKLNVQ